MPKRVAICCDGTWSSYDDPNPTNVSKLRDLIRPVGQDGGRQTVHYDAGIGTHGGLIERAFSGVTGFGLSENVRQAYRALIDTYEEGDVLYLFGFSRGAFTVRSLAGLIRNCGVLRRDRRTLVADAYDFYRDPDPAKKPDSPAAVAFRQRHAVEPVTPIHFIGVWDTVGSLGNPLIRHSLINLRLQFHDVKLSSHIRNAFQALAVDESRRPFEPAVWRQQEHARQQVLRQVWFIGSHSDVGGGYPDPRLSHIALDWLARRALACGLAIDETRLGALLEDGFPSYMSPDHDSRRGLYRWLPAGPRSIDRATAEGEALTTNERLHWTVVARYREDPGYRPPGLVDYLRRNPRLLEGEPGGGHLLEA